MQFSRAMVFANGEVSDLEAVRRLVQADDFLVAVDGGLRYLQALGLTPAWLVGDLDSVSAADVAALDAAGVSIRRYPVAKDETDLELALLALAAEGFASMCVVGALGGRLDQTLGNLSLLALPELAGCDVRLEDGSETIFLIRTMGRVVGSPGDTVSLLPWGGAAEGVLTAGLRYPLHSETLYPERTRGISNVLEGEKAIVRLERGVLICIHSRLRAGKTAEKDSGA